MSDDTAAALVQRHERAAVAAHALAEAILRGHPATLNVVASAWQNARNAFGATRVAGAGTMPLPERRDSQRRAVAIAKEAAETFTGLADRWAALSMDERQTEEHRAKQAAFTAQSQRDLAHATMVAAARPKWQMAGFLGQLAQRGITLAIDSEGRIVATPRGLLDETGRELIRQHRAAIVAALQDGEIV
jgi:hypothetical protein